ncbi:MAG: hypothetical protein WA261_08500, partial [Candidatus Sulfotelmatobacter sp.]
SWMGDALYWIQPGMTGDFPSSFLFNVCGRGLFTKARIKSMTYLDVVFRYGAVPGEAALRAIDGMREVYGVRGVKFNEAERTVRVGYDASRMKADAVAKLLRQAGIDVRDAVALA